MIHSKQKGNLGFSSTIKELHKLGYNVFSELGDLSKIDIIAEKQGNLIRIQVKYVTEKNGIVTLSLKKSGPNGYRYTYCSDDADIFSVYLPTFDKVLFIPAKLACQNKNAFILRFNPTKNCQTKNIHLVEDFSNLAGILRDFTFDACNGDDKVQTTTVKSLVKTKVVS